MARRTYGNKLALGFGTTLALVIVMAVAAIVALRVVVDAKDDAIVLASDDLMNAEQLTALTETRIGDWRLYLITGKQTQLDVANADRERLLASIESLRGTLKDATALTLLNTVSENEAKHAAAMSEIAAERPNLVTLDDVNNLNNQAVVPAREALRRSIDALIKRVQADVTASQHASSTRATQAIWLIGSLGLLALVCGAFVAWRLSRDLRRQVGSAVGHIQSSSAQLEAAAAQQASGGRDQASAMNEITTTISELLITSRQIAESAGRVSQIAEETASAAQTGDTTIDQTRASISAIRSQVDQIVQHMLALGEKSQQIGGIVDLVSELAEQTNILAINATIEASGAGEWGRRFAVVAEEIRKLADRTAGSAKEIRALIEDVRGAVNTTVMATEIGAKSVDAGARQFDDATSSFRRIAQLVATTNDATREIELSTKQQTTAVEQVNVAASDTARVTRETEASAVQTKQTASHLSTLSGELLELVGSGR